MKIPHWKQTFHFNVTVNLPVAHLYFPLWCKNGVPIGRWIKKYVGEGGPYFTVANKYGIIIKYPIDQLVLTLCNKLH